MSWLWGGSKEAKNETTSKLDPSLKEFLEKSSPSDTSAQQTRQVQPTYREQLGFKTDLSEANKSQSPEEKQAVPAQSLYQDGRYAELWKNYRPQAELEEQMKTDQDRLKDLHDRLEDQKHELIRVAQENCALEELKWQKCLSDGSVADRMMLCRGDSRSYYRCFEMQQKVLKALGFMGAMHRNDMSIEEEMNNRDKIQIHADRLYRRMLRRELARKQAEEKGEAAPTFDPLIAGVDGQKQFTMEAADVDKAASANLPDMEKSRVASTFSSIFSSITSQISPTKHSFEHVDLSGIPERAHADFRARLSEQYWDGKITEEQLEIEKQAFKAHHASQKALVDLYMDSQAQQKQEREKRWAENKPTLTDRAARLIGRE